MPVLSGQEGDQASVRLKAIALEQQGMNAEAEQIWNGIVQSNPQNAEALAHLGLLEARQEHYEIAIDYYRRALAVNSTMPGLQMNLGLALFKAAQFPDAIKLFTSEIKKHPGNSRLTILLGMAHYGMKDYLVAVPYLKRATEQDPQGVSLRMTLAQSCMNSKQYQCVLSVHKEITELNAESAEADMLAGEALDQLGDGASATNQFRAAILKNPDAPNAHFGLGYLLWTQRNWTDAASEFQSELQINPRHARARIYLADSWIREGEFAKAQQMLDELPTADKSDSLFHRDLGIIYANNNRSADAIRELTMAAESDPEDTESHLQLAKLYQSIGKRDEANTELDRAKRIRAPGHQSLGEVIDSIEAP